MPRSMRRLWHPSHGPSHPCTAGFQSALHGNRQIQSNQNNNNVVRIQIFQKHLIDKRALGSAATAHPNDNETRLTIGGTHLKMRASEGHWIMRRIALLLCSFAALMGTPLRQMEATADFSRLLVRLSQTASLEPPDGGVGDEPGEVILGHPSDCPAPDSLPSADPLAPPLPLIAVSTPAPCKTADLREQTWWPPGHVSIWLQVFLF